MKNKQQHNEPDPKLSDRNWDFRAFPVRSASVNDIERSVDAVIATEAPVAMFDAGRGRMVPEVLLMSGVRMPVTKQIPLLDSHNRFGLSAQIGSIRNLRVENGEVVGKASFSSLAADEWTKVREGHVTDLSAGYRRHSVHYVPDGVIKEFGGRSFTGPANVVTDWSLKEGSVLSIGADELAKFRGYESGIPAIREEIPLNPELRKALLARGMPETTSDEDAQRWMVEHFKTNPVIKTEEAQRVEKPTTPKTPESSTPIEAVVIANAVKEALRQMEEQRVAHRKSVDDMCELAGVAHLAQRLYDVADVKDVRKKILEEKSAGEVEIGSIRIDAGPAQIDKHRGMIGTALTMRCLDAANVRTERVDAILPKDKRTAGWESFRGYGPFALAEETLSMQGINCRGWTRERVARAAMGDRDAIGFAHRASPAYHTTGSFPQLTKDAVNKVLLAGYEEAPSTWRGPMYQGVSARDFKQLHRIKLGEVPNLKIVPDNAKPWGVSFADDKESYAVEAYSAMTDFSWKLLVNDDMDALSRVPRNFGDAASRTVNAVAWAVVTGNALMSDGVALFSAATGARKKANISATGAPPAVAQLQIASNLMYQQVGMNTPEAAASDAILGITPRYIVGPSALNTTIKQLVLSAYDPAASAFQRYNTATELVPVIEPLLDANSAIIWYLFASPSQVPTIEVTFLEGQETPVTRSWMDEETLSQKFAVLQSFAAKAIDFRGVVRDPGV